MGSGDAWRCGCLPETTGARAQPVSSQLIQPSAWDVPSRTGASRTPRRWHLPPHPAARPGSAIPTHPRWIQGLGIGEGRQRDAGQRIGDHRAPGIRVVEAVIGRQAVGVSLGLLVVVDTEADDPLARRAGDALDGAGERGGGDVVGLVDTLLKGLVEVFPLLEGAAAASSSGANRPALTV